MITPLGCELTAKTVPVTISAGTQCAALYGRLQVQEHFTCRYGLDPSLRDEIDASGLNVVGVDATGEARLIERRDHPFFVGSLFQPQLADDGHGPHPLIEGFVRAAADG